jgi:hypothetical protein
MKEIYCIRFNKVLLKDDLHVTSYEVGIPTLVMGMMKTPLKITLIKNKFTVNFDDNTSHVIPLTESVEYFERLIMKKDAK